MVNKCVVGRALACSAIALTASFAQTATFPTPEAAVSALVTAVQGDKVDRLSEILGPEMLAEVKADDPKLVKFERDLFLLAARKGSKIERDSADRNRAIAYFGDQEWPFPAPLVSVGKSWHFDGKEGLAEVEDRRLGRDELAAIAACRAYVAAQLEYASSDRDDDGVLEYAQQLASTRGKQDGLYWSNDAGEAMSPLGPFFAQAAFGSDNAAPLAGYYFRILTRQGAGARGGARDFKAGDDMVLGFALVAWPAEYGVTGVSTFIVNQLGTIYQKDLGKQTAGLVKAMSEFNPDTSCTQVVDD